MTDEKYVRRLSTSSVTTMLVFWPDPAAMRLKCFCHLYDAVTSFSQWRTTTLEKPDLGCKFKTAEAVQLSRATALYMC